MVTDPVSDGADGTVKALWVPKHSKEPKRAKSIFDCI
jgi:hypothetical protein